MSQAAISTFLYSWLVLAVVLFALIVLRAYSPSQASVMERNARIPFENEKRDDDLS